MKTQITRIVLCLLVVLTTIACKKENQNTNSNAISAGWWQKTAQTSTNTSTGAIDDTYAPLSACEKDNLIRFNTDGTYSWAAGATKCSASEPDEVADAGDWNITGGKLTMDDGFLVRLTNGEILINNSTTLRVAFPNALGASGYTLTITYTKR
ncbi:MAG TPA: hypothetical protein PKO18_00210 [Chitinophagales bacterium]|nr:hypothetical protein [Chitinophagales bacterium]